MARIIISADLRWHSSAQFNNSCSSVLCTLQAVSMIPLLGLFIDPSRTAYKGQEGERPILAPRVTPSLTIMVGRLNSPYPCSVNESSGALSLIVAVARHAQVKYP
jgi:hypothetical protein